MVSEINRSMIVQSNPSAASEICQWLLSSLKEHGFCEDDVFAIHLAFEEAFYNAVRHGNKMNPEKKVKIDCFICSDKAEVSMTDTGKGFDPNSVPDCRCGENLYKTEGRGLLLIRSFMDIVEFNKQGNTIHMIRYKKKPAAAKKSKATL